MGRWDISDPNRIHSAELPVPSEEQQRQSNGTSPSVRRGGSSDGSAEELASRQRPVEERPSRPKERRTKHEDRGRIYSLRSSEMKAMTDIGRFRAVDVRDLARFVYKGDSARMKNDLGNLRKQGLIEEKTLLRAHKPTRRMVTLTEQGHRMVKKGGAVAPEQKIYHGFVKPKELDHDADLYKVYQKAAQKIEETGGKPVRIRLDLELKESINQAKEAAGQLPEQMRERFLGAVAHEHGLTADRTTIHLPDVQVEYQTPDGRIERENLELVSRNYREQGIRGKAAAGFSMYARAGDSARVRRALRDSGLIREVLSL
jgi:DNA-binding PadR family transcriptional regulator